jgi:hypothetical protein
MEKDFFNKLMIQRDRYVKLKYGKRLQQVDDPKRQVYHSIRNLKCSIFSQPDATHLGYDLWERFVAT